MAAVFYCAALREISSRVQHWLVHCYCITFHIIVKRFLSICFSYCNNEFQEYVSHKCP